jgi:hypothetical protein
MKNILNFQNLCFGVISALNKPGQSFFLDDPFNFFSVIFALRQAFSMVVILCICNSSVM